MPPKRRNPTISASALARMGQMVELFTVRDRARALGISFGHMADVERGSCMPSPDLMDRMAATYKRPIEHIERGAKLARETYAHRIIESARDIR